MPVVSSRPKIDFAERGEARIFGGRRALIVVACVVRRPKAAALVLRHSARSLLELAGEGKLDDIDERVTAPRHIRKFCEWKKMQSSSAASLAVGRPLVPRGRSAPMCRRDVHKAQPNSGWAQTPQLSGAGKPIDLVSTAIRLGTSFVGGSFPATRCSLSRSLKRHSSTRARRFIDVHSPCVTFNDRAGSTGSFNYVHGRNIVLNTLDIIAALELIEEDLRRRERKGVTMHEGSTIALRKLDVNHHCRDRSAAMMTPISCLTFSAPLTGRSTTSCQNAGLYPRSKLLGQRVAEIGP